MIVTSPILTTDYGEKIRKWLLSDLTLDSVVDFGELDVFPGVGVRTCILVIENTPPGPGHQVQVSSPESVSALGSQERPLPQEVFRQSMGATIRVGLTEENLALKRRIDKLSGVTNWRWHDLRRTARSGMSRLGVDSRAASAALNHISDRSKLERTYDRYDYQTEAIAALQRWQAHVAALVAEAEAKQNRKTAAVAAA